MADEDDVITWVKLTRDAYEDYDIASIRQLADIHRQNGNDFRAETLEEAFAPEFQAAAEAPAVATKTAVETALPVDNHINHYIPIKERGYVEGTLSTAAVGLAFTAMSEMTREQANKRTRRVTT